MKKTWPVFEIPPDSVPSEQLIASVKYYIDSGKPLLYLARMRSVPYGFILYIKSSFIEGK